MVKLLGALLLTGIALAGDVTLNIGALRLMPQRWNKQANFAKMERYAREAAAKGANLVITPEGFLEGYVGNDHANKDLTREKYFDIGESIDGALLSRTRDLAKELKIYLLLGFAERRGDRMYNSLAIFSPEGRLAHKYSKAHNADDEPYNTTGTEFPVAETSLGRWGTLICYDRQLPETSRILSIKGAQLIIVPAWGGYGEMNDAMMRTRAFENGVYVAFVHPQRALIIDPRGNIVAQDSRGDDEIVMARIVLDQRIGKSAIRSRKPELYRGILEPRTQPQAADESPGAARSRSK
jgi:predicted amidohydrolase